MGQESQTKYLTLTFMEKYALKFYISIISQSLVLWILFHTQSALLSLTFIAFYNALGKILPIKVDHDREKMLNKIQNTNKYLLGPLISNCISTPVIMYFVWRNYNLLPLNSPFEVFLTIVSLSFIVSTSIDAAHELLHRTEPICKFFSYLNLFCLQFTIYPTEHLYLHHKKVGTPQDPITAPKNMSVYKFYFNALFSCYKFNFSYSKQIFAFNVCCTFVFNLILIIAAEKEGSGINKALFFTSWCYLSLFIMEIIEYIEHYGLIYRSNEKAKPVTEISSWNAAENQLLNWFVFRFQRHSDHHMNAYKIYPTLDLNEKMPHFPFDFVSGMILALCPPLWYYIMNPLADQIVQGKAVTKTHRQFVDNVVKTLCIVLLILFPLKLVSLLLL